ncbi:MAG: histidine kinase, partial [Eubacteriales bacterium]|nr:histidine kinase [Eubacteriales bacterium]
KNDNITEQYINMIEQENKLKYQLLQAEINPHFLFNSLNSVCDCIISGDSNSAMDMIRKLAEFYRLILKTPDDLITIEQELHITELYLQMIRYCKKLKINWEFEIEEGIENYYICKFVFQPLIENTVIHGINSEMDELIIKIKMMYYEDSIKISIADNGAGITPENLELIREKLNHNDIISKNNYGLINVDRRMQAYYSLSKHLDIQSKIGEGTVCTFFLKPIFDGKQE